MWFKISRLIWWHTYSVRFELNIYNTYKYGCNFYLHIQNIIKHPWTSFPGATNTIWGLSKPNFKFKVFSICFLNWLYFYLYIHWLQLNLNLIFLSTEYTSAWKKKTLSHVWFFSIYKNTTIRFSRTWDQ